MQCILDGITSAAAEVESSKLWIDFPEIGHGRYNTVLENYWDRSKPIYPSGQIELQNHGNTLWFRNVYLKELDGDEGSDSK